MSSRFCIGIDPGNAGAIVCVKMTDTRTSIHWAEPLPTIKTPDRTVVDIRSLMLLLADPLHPIILEVPQTGYKTKYPASQAGLQFQCGQIDGALRIYCFPRWVYPSTWRSYFKLPKHGDKTLHRDLAAKLFGRDDTLKYLTGPDGGTSTREGQVDAALIGLYGLLNKGE